ncbi:MAG TPA: hypothetical protein VNI36_10260 [Candidatus Dormibacteraeota bacterium]|nr:hypothetical protein [Candidatus Dormibacteraeota bacterium]
MRTLILMVAAFLLVPALRAQQAESKQEPPQAPAQVNLPAAKNATEQTHAPESIRPGHPLEPADVDILTGKRDRKTEASRRPVLSIAGGGISGGYGYYGDDYAMNGRATMPFRAVLPLTRISNPYFFFNVLARGYGRRAFRDRR